MQKTQTLRGKKRGKLQLECFHLLPKTPSTQEWEKLDRIAIAKKIVIRSTHLVNLPNILKLLSHKLILMNQNPTKHKNICKFLIILSTSFEYKATVVIKI